MYCCLWSIKMLLLGVIYLIKVHLTPNFFPRQINSVVIWSISPQKAFDFVESLIFCARLKYGKSSEINRHHFGSGSSSEGMGLVTLWRQIKNSQSHAIFIEVTFLLSSRRRTENCWPFVLLGDLVTKETNHKTYHYIIQHSLTTSGQRRGDEISGFCKAIASKAAVFQALDTRLDAILTKICCRRRRYPIKR